MRLIACVALVLVTTPGCGRKKNEDCQKLVQAVGPQHASVSAAYSRSDQTAADLEAQAAGWDKAAQELAALPLESEEVKSLAAEFSRVLTKAAKIRRDMAAAAANSLDPTAAVNAQAQAVSFMVEETKAKAALDMTCR